MAPQVDKLDAYKRDLDELESLIEELKRQYDMYFAGVLKKQPYELKGKVDAMFRRNRGAQVHKLELTFRFNSIQSKYAKYVELWDKIFKRREIDPHAVSPYGPTRSQLATEMANVNRARTGGGPAPAGAGVPAQTAQAAAQATPEDRTQRLFNQYLDAKKELGESVDSLKFASFRGQIEKQIQAIKDKTGAQDVEFSVVRKEGKVTLSAKPKKS